MREVVRATGLEELAGTRAPVTGLLELRGTPVPVVDLRTGADPADDGDVLVLSTPRASSASRWTRCPRCSGRTTWSADPSEPCPQGLPAYVVEVRRDPAGRAVLVVSLLALAGLVSS